MFNFVVITVPADVLAPLGARASAGTVMTKSGFCVYIYRTSISRVKGLSWPVDTDTTQPGL